MRLRSRTEQEHGFSLIELLVVLVVFSVVGGIVMSATISGLEATRRAQQRVQALNELTVSIERIGRELRAASAVDATRLDLVARDANAQVAVTVQRGDREYSLLYYLDEATVPSTLRFNVEASDLDGLRIPSEDRAAVFVTNAGNADAGVPLVRYFRSDGTELCAGAISDADCLAELGEAAYMELAVARLLTDQSEPIIVRTTVAIRSTRFQ